MSILSSIITYFSGGFKYSVPNELVFTYFLGVIRMLFFSYVITYFFMQPYSVIVFAVAIILADIRFYLDFSDAVDEAVGEEENDDLF